MSPTITTHPQAATKVTADHLRRDAYLYVRQSTLRQVLHNTTSTQRQYDLRGRAIALGWTAEQLIVIDTDQGQSGASAVDRDGFQRLVAEVGMGHAGIVLGLEVSRLARNNTDWHRLLEICALSGTLILDEDGLYDPCNFNDRLLLGLKGSLSEAELHLLKGRLRGGVLSKARRGELIQPLPVGLVYAPAGKVVLDPDTGVQQAIRHLFATFTATGSALATVKAFRQHGLTFPRRLTAGQRKGELVWGPLEHSGVLRVLHNPRYAGAFFYGRHTHRSAPGGKTSIITLPRDQWTVLITDAHPGYITWQQFEANQNRLAEQSTAFGHDHRHGPPREGPALLQGLAVCGVCGRRMTVRYHTRRGTPLPDYVCQNDGIRTATPICQTIPGAGIDTAIGAFLIDTLTPLARETALAVADELATRAADFPALWNNPATPLRERKRMVRLLIDDVTIRRDKTITVHIRLKGGQHQTLTLPLPLASWQLRKTPPDVVAAINDLTDEHTDSQIATILEQRGFTSGTGQPLHARLIRQIREAYHLPSHTQRLRAAGLLTLNEIARRLGVSPNTVKTWRNKGLLTGRLANDKGEYLYQLPDPNLPRPRIGRPPRNPTTTETTSASTTRSAV